MGATHVTVTVRNPAEPERAWEGEFLVDTGALNSVVPSQHLKAVGIRPHGTRRFELADGSVADLDVGIAYLEFLGETTLGTVVFADDDTSPLLGLTAQRNAGMEYDPTSQRFKPIRHLLYPRRPVRQALGPDQGRPIQPDTTPDDPAAASRR